MKIIVDKEILFKAIIIADSIISSKNVNTILSNCLLIISKNFIEIISTDNEIAIRTKIVSSSNSEGIITVNGKKLSGILKELPNDDIELNINENFIIDIKSKSKDVKGNYSLIGTSGEEYPKITEFNKENSIEIDQLILKEMIKKIMYAASIDTIKPVFNGLYFISDIKGTISAVATDSRRLSIIRRNVENEIMIDNGVILPLKTVHELFRLLSSSGRCIISINDNQCFVKIDETEIISKVVDGQFPNYKQVIPIQYLAEASVETKKLLNSVKRVMVFTREPVNKIIMTFSKTTLVIEANTPDLGQAEEEVSIESNVEEKISIGVNAQFLLDTLKEIDSFSIKCGITGQMSPLTIIPEDDKNYTSVIMPIQIRN